jgi:hypothetical protein
MPCCQYLKSPVTTIFSVDPPVSRRASVYVAQLVGVLIGLMVVGGMSSWNPFRMLFASGRNQKVFPVLPKPSPASTY